MVERYNDSTIEVCENCRKLVEECHCEEEDYSQDVGLTALGLIAIGLLAICFSLVK